VTTTTTVLGKANESEHAELRQFLVYLGSGLTASGEAVNEIEEHLRRVAAEYGAPDARISVLPTFVVVALDHEAIIRFR
jgi:uncharacterized membrane protein YjjP (DUF1212 family)